MSIQKSQIKADVAKGFGQDLEKALENAQVKVYKLQGAHDALVQSSTIIADMTGAVRDKLFKDEIKFDPEDPLAVAKFVAGQMQAVVAKLRELGEMTKYNAIKAEGERVGIELAVGRAKSMFDEENAKLAAFVKAVESGKLTIEDGEPVNHGRNRSVGTHPGPTLKSIRQAEAAVEEADKGNGVTPKKTSRRKRVKSDAGNA